MNLDSLVTDLYNRRWVPRVPIQNLERNPHGASGCHAVLLSTRRHAALCFQVRGFSLNHPRRPAAGCLETKRSAYMPWYYSTSTRSSRDIGYE